ncbi:MAG: HAD family phosphatase [Bacteroidales bacterium]|nr:HAD family phosphatase [Bacteroidales bacterium]
MIEAVIFDMDGVLVDSERLHHDVDTQIYHHFGITVPESERSLFVGLSVQKVYSIICSKYPVPRDFGFLVEFDRRYRAVVFSRAPLQVPDGLKDFLEKLKKLGIKAGVASGSSLELIDVVLKKLHLEEYFTVRVSSEAVERSKPFPDVFLRTASLLATEPENCMVIEDSGYGLTAARAAGMTGVGYFNPGSGIQDFTMADHVIHSFKDPVIETILS